MTPQEFCKKWKVKRSQLALLLGVSQVTVDHWFSSKSPREAQPDTLQRLDEYDALLECWQNYQRFQAERFPVLYEIFLAVTEE